MSRFRLFASCAVFAALPVLAHAEEMAPTALNSLSTAPSLAASMRVMDQHGNILGQAQRIQTDQDGKPAALAFRAGNGSIVVIGAAAISYDGTSFVADNEQPQVAALNAARVASVN